MCPTLLVVDDDLGIHKMVLKRGEKDGFRVLAALTLRDGLRLVGEHRPDAVLLDMNLPDGLGSQLLQQLKSDPRTRRIPIIVWSGRHCRELKEAALHAGAVACVPKSDLGILMATLRAMVRGND